LILGARSVGTVMRIRILVRVGPQVGRGGADCRGMSRVTWQLWVSFTVVVIGSYLLVPASLFDGWPQTIYKVVIGCAAACGIVAGVRRRRPPGSLAWVLFGGGILANALGPLASDIWTKSFGGTGSPSVADAFWLLLYPGLFLGVGMLIRARGATRDWATLVDAVTVATGLGLLSWVFFMEPVTADHTVSVFGQIVVMAYPAGDIVVLAMLLRLLLGGGVKNTSFWLISTAMLMFLAGDVAWAVLSQLQITPSPLVSSVLDTVFLFAYALFAFAAWHPSVRALGERAESRPPRLSPAQLLTLTGATLIAPGILIAEVLRNHLHNHQAVAVAAGSVVLFLLVVTRMAQLLRQVEAQAGQLRALTRSDALTGLPNRRAWSDELPVSIERARREGAPLTVAMIDLDHFKRFNDEFGHQAGDRLLKSAASAWTAELRAVDQLARYGGEEFILLLPGAPAALAVEIVARVRAATPLGQTFSAGLAVWDGVESSEEMIARADAALYAAKAAGRSRTEVATPALTV
jgi:diguanylate cyclase (GGDEF)-like protein